MTWSPQYRGIAPASCAKEFGIAPSNYRYAK